MAAAITIPSPVVDPPALDGAEARGYPSDVNDDERMVAAEGVVSRVLDGEAVLLDLASGKYFGLNEVGSRLWEHVQEEIAFSELLRKLHTEYEVDIADLRRDVEELLGELESKGLITLTSQ